MKKTLLIALQLFFFCNLTFAKDLVNSKNTNECSVDALNVVPIFDIQTTYCEGETPQQLPSVSLNGVIGTWIPSVINTSFSDSYTFLPNVGQDAVLVTIDITIATFIDPIFTIPQYIYLGDEIPLLPSISENGISGSWTVSETIIDGVLELIVCDFVSDGLCPVYFTHIIQVIPISNPVAPSPQTFNSGSTLADIVITPSNVLWYDSFDDAQADVNRLALDLPLENNKTYYAVNDDGEYRSQPFPVTVIVTLNTASFELQNLKFYPNPVSSDLTISNSFPIQSIEIYNLLGQRLINESYDATEVNINVSNLPSALYLVKIKSENEAKEFKIVKE
jgi:hypothetical protein